TERAGRSTCWSRLRSRQHGVSGTGPPSSPTRDCRSVTQSSIASVTRPRWGWRSSEWRRESHSHSHSRRRPSISSPTWLRPSSGPSPPRIRGISPRSVQAAGRPRRRHRGAVDGGRESGSAGVGTDDRPPLNDDVGPEPAHPKLQFGCPWPFWLVLTLFCEAFGHTLDHKGKPLARGGRKATGLSE